ncbi:MAG: PorT family protein [Acidobacteria bacterium]|nr:PorT family protein [Acidobacteriota bacterium]
MTRRLPDAPLSRGTDTLDLPRGRVSRVWPVGGHLLAACAILLAGGTHAFGQGLEVGVKGGVNLASITFDEDGPSVAPHVGAVGGGFVVIPLTSVLSAQVEGLYSAKGVRLTEAGIDSSLRVEYLELPLLARFTRRGSTRNYHVAAGPALGWRLRARSRVDFGSVVEEFDLTDDVERFDIGIAVAAGVDFARLTVDARYTFGVRDIDADRTDTVVMKNRAASITVGLRF